MLITRKIIIKHSKEVANAMCNAARESDVIYNEAMKVKLAQPDASQYDLIYLIKDWRKIFHLTHHFNMHEMASKQAHTAVTLFRASNEEKHDRRKKHKHQVRTGKRKKYVRNKWTEPTSLYRKLRQDGRLHTVVTRETPKLNDNGTLRLPGFGTVRVCSSMPDGIIKSFQLVDDTNKITKRTTSYDRKFKLHVQVEIPDKPPLEGKYAGMDRGIKCLVAVSDSHGNQRLHNIPDSCRRSKNDKIDRMKAEQSKHRVGSRSWKRIGRDIRRALQRIQNKQLDAQRAVARRITEGIAIMFVEGLELKNMKKKDPTSQKQGLNRELGYASLGSMGRHAEWEMKKKGGLYLSVPPAYTSQTCSRCGMVDKESRNKSDFICVFCGWYHHADTEAGETIRLKGRPQLWTGGQASNLGVVIADNEVVIRREDHVQADKDQPVGWLGPGNDDDTNTGRSDRTPERESSGAT